MLYTADFWRNQGNGDAAKRRAEADRMNADWTFATVDPVFTEPDAEPDFAFPPIKDDTDLAPGFRTHLTRKFTLHEQKQRGASRQIETRMDP